MQWLSRLARNVGCISWLGRYDKTADSHKFVFKYIYTDLITTRPPHADCLRTRPRLVLTRPPSVRDLLGA